MRPTQWRRSTHVVIGVAVVLLVAAAVVAAARARRGWAVHQRRRRRSRRTRAGDRRARDHARLPTPRDKPTPDGLAATLAPLSPTRTSAR